MQNKKQHTVPICYLKNFADAKGQIHVLRDDTIFKANPRGVLADDNFYTVTLGNGEKTLEVETTLTNIEGSFATIFREKISRYQPLSDQERAVLAVFVAAMIMRTRKKRAFIASIFEQVRQSVEQMTRLSDEQKLAMSRMSPETGNGIPAEAFLALGEDLSTFHSVSLVNSLEKMAQIIIQMRWAFGVVTSEQDYHITCDNPVLLFNPLLEQRFGPDGIYNAPTLEQKDVELSMPLSSEISLLAGWQLDFDGLYIPLPRDIVEQQRLRTLRSAYREIIARQDDFLRTVRYGKPPEA